MERGYQKDLPWRLRKLLEQMIARLPRLKRTRQRQFARCLVLRVGQWAFDCKKHLPTVGEFREEICDYGDNFIDGMRDFRKAVYATRRDGKQKAEVVQCRASDIEHFVDVRGRRPKLVVTSPPYPGVYVLYHRWKIRGRRETPAPFWVADCRDGHGQAHYCFGDRKHQELVKYFAGIRESFIGVRKIVSRKAMIVQIVAFAEPEWQIDRYLEAMENAGFTEVLPRELGIKEPARLWRHVPGRKWYARLHGDLSSSQEVVLFHRPS